MGKLLLVNLLQVVKRANTPLNTLTCVQRAKRLYKVCGNGTPATILGIPPFAENSLSELRGSAVPTHNFVGVDVIIVDSSQHAVFCCIPKA